MRKQQKTTKNKIKKTALLEKLLNLKVCMLRLKIYEKKTADRLNSYVIYLIGLTTPKFKFNKTQFFKLVVFRKAVVCSFSFS